MGKKFTYLLLFILLGLANSMLGQNLTEIEGRVINKETNEPIPFANIYNSSLEKGTISNTDGYFRIPIKGVNDTIQITFIGFKNFLIRLQNSEDFYLINLEENILSLSEVTITPADNSYLVKLIQKCKKSIPNIDKTSKAYYELKTFENNNQIELVEGYYNVNLKGYKVDKLNLKAGRLAIRQYSNRFFVSLESSQAIIMLNIFNGSDYFPKNPFQLSKSKLNKYYYLNLDSKYVEGNTDSIYVIDYTPKDTTGLFFQGKIWINKSKNHIIKLTLNCNSALKHPFLPKVQTDTISNVSFNITQSFKSFNGQIVFNHTDFIYTIDYKSSHTEQQSHSIQTKAVLYAYDYETPFFLLYFDISEHSIGDYRKISAMPYNDFFWQFNDEYRLNDSLNTNELFFTDSTSINNKLFFKSFIPGRIGFFEHPYISWSNDRIRVREILPDSSSKSNSIRFISEQYNLAVKFYLDINTYKDSTNIITSAIIDPYESFYHLPMDNQTHCFLNIYFDLCEIERRELEGKLNAEKSNLNSTMEIYNDCMTQFEIKKNEFLKAVERGTNEKEMMKYNTIVLDKLGIDNIALFQPYSSE